jgi:hypothetical protein
MGTPPSKNKSEASINGKWHAGSQRVAPHKHQHQPGGWPQWCGLMAGTCRVCVMEGSMLAAAVGTAEATDREQAHICGTTTVYRVTVQQEQQELQQQQEHMQQQAAQEAASCSPGGSHRRMLSSRSIRSTVLALTMRCMLQKIRNLARKRNLGTSLPRPPVLEEGQRGPAGAITSSITSPSASQGLSIDAAQDTAPCCTSTRFKKTRLKPVTPPAGVGRSPLELNVPHLLPQSL